MKPAGLKRGDDEDEEGKEEEYKVEEKEKEKKDTSARDVKRRKHSKQHRSDRHRIPLLIQRIRNYFDGSDPPDTELDPDLLRQLLEASSGDVNVAAGFFWDNYLASASRMSPGKRQQDSSSSDKRKRSDSSSRRSSSAAARRQQLAPQGNENEKENDREDVNDEEEDVRTIRRRLEGRFNQADGQEEEDLDMDMESVGNQEPIPAAAVAVAAINNNNQVDDDDDDDMDEADQIPNPDADDDAIAGSVSVSDDEGAGIWRMERRRRQAIQDDDTVRRNIGIGRISRNISDRVEPPPGNDNVDRSRQVVDNDDANPTTDRTNPRQVVANADANPRSKVVDNDDDETYLSDDDWLTGKSISTTTPRSPSKNLWGLPSLGGTNQDSPNNVLEEDDDADVSLRTTKISRTWLNAGFSMATDGGGLTTKPPTEEDVVFYRWRQQQNGDIGDTRNMVLPPYHCKAVTAVLAVVNATMLTGASIQGNCVDCSSARTPFAELSEKERLKEFDSRLGDAIAALLFVALKASTGRKQRAIAAREKLKDRATQGNGDFDRMQKQTVARKLRLCPTCRWQEDPAIGEARLAEAREASIIQVVTSFTNISDLRSYVKSNMRFFAGKCGCALLLETIIRIHGKGTVERMIRKSRQNCQLPVNKCFSLIKCTCEERQSKIKRPKQSGAAANKPILDTTPPGHECLSTELFSLLVCGEVHSTFKGWSSGNLGFGLLSDAVGEVGVPLTKPSKPVWILRGATCHSVAWIDTIKQRGFDMTQLDQQGTVMHMSHWNFWHGHRNQSSFRVNTARGKWSPTSLFKRSAGVDDPSIHSKVLNGIVQRKKQLQQQSHIVSGDEQDDEASRQAISEQELNELIVNQDDQRFYPKEYRRWRYKFQETNNDGGWLGYHGLNDRERRIVEMKLAPRINPILWSRWPNSVVDKFTPDDEPFPIV